MTVLDFFNVARVLGCSPQEAKSLLVDQRLTLEEAEALALERYSWRRHTRDPDSYWVTVMAAAEILGVSVQRVKQLLERDFLPYVTHVSGARLMRRDQLETVANARTAHKLQGSA